MDFKFRIILHVCFYIIFCYAYFIFIIHLVSSLKEINFAAVVVRSKATDVEARITADLDEQTERRVARVDGITETEEQGRNKHNRDLIELTKFTMAKLYYQINTIQSVFSFANKAYMCTTVYLYSILILMTSQSATSV